MISGCAALYGLHDYFDEGHKKGGYFGEKFWRGFGERKKVIYSRPLKQHTPSEFKEKRKTQIPLLIQIDNSIF